jgi:DNA invertase Pin-like site-specific DNA recombinase
MRCENYEARQSFTLDRSCGDDGIYSDGDISGGREDRDGYNRLLRDIITGKLKGKYIIVRDQERLTRGKSSRFEELTYNAELGGVRIFDATTGREIKDDMTSGILAVVARQDRKRTGILQRGRKEWHALQGDPPSGTRRRFGYTLGYTQIIWEEAKWLRRIRHWILAGRSSTSIVNELRARGITRPDGKSFLVKHISLMMPSPVYAAIRAYPRDLEIDGVIIPAGEKVADGTWPRIFTEAEHRELLVRFSQNKPFSESNKAKHLLVGILVCDECGTKLSVGYAKGKKQYKCDGQRPGACGGVGRNLAAVDDFIVDLTYQTLKRMPKPSRPSGGNGNTRRQIKMRQEKISEARQAYKADAISLEDFVDIRNSVQSEIEALRKLLSENLEIVPLDSADDFLGTEDMIKKRDTIRRLWPVIGVKKVGKGHKFHADQLVFPKGEGLIESHSSTIREPGTGLRRPPVLCFDPTTPGSGGYLPPFLR